MFVAIDGIEEVMADVLPDQKQADPDPAAVELARKKAARAGSSATFEQGNFTGPETNNDSVVIVDKVTCSLGLHQVPLAEKGRLLRAMFERLRRRPTVHC